MGYLIKKEKEMKICEYKEVFNKSWFYFCIFFCIDNFIFIVCWNFEKSVFLVK